MNWISWVLPVLIVLPLVGGVLAGIITSDRVRYTLVTALAVLIAAGGIGVVYLSTLSDNGIWTMTAAPWMAYAGTGLELAIIAVILVIALKIKNVWIAIIAVPSWRVPRSNTQTPVQRTREAVCASIEELAYNPPQKKQQEKHGVNSVLFLFWGE